MQLEDILPIVRQHAKYISGKWHDSVIDYDDLYQEGAIVALQILNEGIQEQHVMMTYSYLHKRISGRMRDVLRLAQGRTIDKRMESIDAFNKDDQDNILDDTVSVESPEDVYVAKEAIERTIRCLRPREYVIIEMMVEGCSGVQIARRLGVDPGRVSQIFYSQIRQKLLTALQ